jgi:hypothetical protein
MGAAVGQRSLQSIPLACPSFSISLDMDQWKQEPKVKCIELSPWRRRSQLSKLLAIPGVLSPDGYRHG